MSFLEKIPSSEKSSVQVAVRIRPLNDRESNTATITTVQNNNILITNPDDKKKKTFVYDYVYDIPAKQEDIYADIGKNIIDAAYKGYNGCVFAYGQTGCFAKGTQIMMYSSDYKNVEDIKVGDRIMGDDSTVRNVLKLFKGQQQMYNVQFYTSAYNTSYVVNEDHILVLYDKKSKEIIEMSIKDYIKINFYDAVNRYKCITTSVEFPEQKVDDPYLFGNQFDTRSDNQIPLYYLHNSKKNRLALLAGLLDQCDDILYIPRYATKNDTVKYLIQSLGFGICCEKYNELEELMILLGDKNQIPFRKIHNDDFASYNNTHPFIVIPTSVDNYYGFMLDGNHRFIGAGFNILRNSGKTFAMMGGHDQVPIPMSNGQASSHLNTQGLIPRICQALFEKQITHNDVPKGECDITYKVEFSYLEIYSEEVRDLLRKDNPAGGLRVRQHPEYGPYVEGLSQILVEDYKSIKRLIDQGNKERVTASTLMNMRSSRSHAILTLYFTQVIQEPNIGKTREIVSRINLVDLAGSERVDESGVTGLNFKEAININKSLSALGLVIGKLASRGLNALATPGSVNKSTTTVSKSVVKKPILRKTNIMHSGLAGPHGVTKSGSRGSSKSNSPIGSPRGKIKASNVGSQVGSQVEHVPFRDSVLTWILKESLGGNSKTYMIATVSPSAINYSETLNTLRYASNAKQIVNTVKINEDPNDKIIRVLKDEIDNLREQLKLKGSIHSTTPIELKQLKDEITQREELMKEKEKSWEQKLEESKKINVQVKEQLKLEVAQKEEELRKAEEKLETLKQQHVSEIERLKSELEQTQLQVNERGLSDQKVQEELEKKQIEFEQSRIVGVSEKLSERYEQKLEIIRSTYEEKLETIKKQYEERTVNEIEKLRATNTQLSNQLAKSQKDLQAQIKQSTIDRSVLSKQIQQLQAKIHTYEQSSNGSNEQELQKNQELQKKNQEILDEIATNKTLLENLKFEYIELQVKLEN